MQSIAKIAKDLGFDSKIVSDKPWQYSNREELRELIWLTQLRTFILETWKNYISVRYRIDGTFEFWISYVMDCEFHEDDSNYSYDTELEALRAGIEYFLYNIK